MRAINININILKTLAAVLIGVASFSSPALGEIDLLTEIYGEGVHAFWRGDPQQAQQFFDQAIKHGYKDPRAYYYRALIHLCAGRTYNAEQDIQLGARFELEGRGTYDIGAALYRFQGCDRVRFERMRRDAKLELITSRAVPWGIDPSYQPPLTDPGIPTPIPGLNDPFADESEEPEIPVPDVQPGIDDDLPFEPPAEPQPQIPPQPPADTPVEPSAPTDEPEPTLPSDDDPFGGADDPFAPPS